MAQGTKKITVEGTAREQIDFVLRHITEELQLLADLHRRKSRYKKYRPGMRRALTNRAVGLEKAIKIVESVFPEDPYGDPTQK